MATIASMATMTPTALITTSATMAIMIPSLTKNWNNIPNSTDAAKMAIMATSATMPPKWQQCSLSFPGGAPLFRLHPVPTRKEGREKESLKTEV